MYKQKDPTQKKLNEKQNFKKMLQKMADENDVTWEENLYALKESAPQPIAVRQNRLSKNPSFFGEEFHGELHHPDAEGILRDVGQNLMNSFKVALIYELECMKNGVFNAEKLKEVLGRMSDTFILDDEILLKVYAALRGVSQCDNKKLKDEIVLMLKTLFDRVENYGKAVIAFFDSCSDHDDGPFGIRNFDIGSYILKMEKYIGGDNELTPERCYEPSKLLAWSLIGNTQECLQHLCNQTLIMQDVMVHFLRHVFGIISDVCNYDAHFKNLKGSLILKSFCDMLQRFAEFPVNLEALRPMLLKMSIPKKQSQLSLIPPRLLFEEVMKHLLKKDMMGFWVHILAEFVRALKNRTVQIDWDSTKSNMFNPIILCVFLIKTLYAKNFAGFESEEVFKNLGEVFKAHGIVLNNTNAFFACNEVDWASITAYMDFLQVPSTSYKRQLPAALYFVLSEDMKNNYHCLKSEPPSLENYLTGIFELAFVADYVPDELVKGCIKYSTESNVVPCIPLCIYRAFNNVVNLCNGKIKKHVYQIIVQFIDLFNCPIDLAGESCTPRLLEALLDIQHCLIIGQAALMGIFTCKVLHQLPRSTKIVYQDLNFATHQLIITFLTLANKYYSPYHDELRAALQAGKRQIPESKLPIMSAVYVLLQKVNIAIYDSLENHPNEMKLLAMRLGKYSESYKEYIEKHYD